MKRQIKNLNGIVGLTVDSAVAGIRDSWHEGDCIVISFSNNAFVVIEAERNWSEDADAMVDTEVPRPSEFLVAAGVFTLEEYESYRAGRKRKQDAATRTRELEQLAKLKAKYRA